MIAIQNLENVRTYLDTIEIVDSRPFRNTFRFIYLPMWLAVFALAMNDPERPD